VRAFVVPFGNYIVVPAVFMKTKNIHV